MRTNKRLLLRELNKKWENHIILEEEACSFGQEKGPDIL
jgi:hypothetical protein